MPVLPQEVPIYPENLLDEPPVQAGRLWWAVYTKARQEKSLARELLKYQVPFYLPLVPKRSLRRGRSVQSFLPLFTGYLFVFGSEEERLRTLTTNRVSHMLPVPDQEQLRGDLQSVHRLIQLQAPLTVESRLTTGRRVRIRTGAMMGLEGVVETRKGGCRLVVAVTFLQQGVSVEIDDFQVEPID